MKHLLLLRHAKAVTGEPGMPDRDRELAARGQSDATLMGTELVSDPPDAVLCSPARRTRQTLDAALAEFAEKPEIVYVEALYGEPDDYIAAIADNGGDAQRLLVVGHNPAIQITASELVGSGKRKLRDRLMAKFPTGALATIAFEADDWHDIRPGSGTLVALVRPRDLGPDSGEN